MRGAALAKVQLDRVRRPPAVLVLDDDEVDGEPTEHAEARQVTPDQPSRVRRSAGSSRSPPGRCSRGSSDRWRRRASGRGWTAARPSRRAATRIWTLGLVSACAGDPLLDDPAVVSGMPSGTPRWVRFSASGCNARTRSRDRRRLVGRARGGQLAQVDHRVAGSRDALVELHDRLRHRRASRPHAAQRRRRRRRRCAGPRLRPGIGHRARRTAAGTRSCCPRSQAAGRRRTSGCPGDSATSRSSAVVL